MKEQEYRIIVAGSRTFYNYNLLKVKLHEIISNLYAKNSIPISIVSGCANGADKLGVKYAEEFNIKLYKFPAKWELYGKSAGYIRNSQMLDFAIKDGNKGVLVAFWDGFSRGTNHMIELAKRAGIDVYVIKIEKE